MKPNESVAAYLKHVQKVECPGLITLAEEWIAEGWGLEGEATPEQLAAAIFMEANTQDICVKDGDSVAEYPILLRVIGHKILRLCGHCDPTLEELGRAIESLGESKLRQLLSNLTGQTPA